jgi:HEAT repeat protein
MTRISVSRAIKRLVGMTRTDVAPVFHDLLRSPHTDVRAGVVQALIRFADPKSIEPIVKLLDDPDVDVRARALEAVKEIRKTLEERDEWKKWAKDAARPAGEGRKN